MKRTVAVAALAPFLILPAAARDNGAVQMLLLGRCQSGAQCSEAINSTSTAAKSNAANRWLRTWSDGPFVFCGA